MSLVVSKRQVPEAAAKTRNPSRDSVRSKGSRARDFLELPTDGSRGGTVRDFFMCAAELGSTMSSALRYNKQRTPNATGGTREVNSDEAQKSLL